MPHPHKHKMADQAREEQRIENQLNSAATMINAAVGNSFE